MYRNTYAGTYVIFVTDSSFYLIYYQTLVYRFAGAKGLKYTFVYQYGIIFYL